MLERSGRLAGLVLGAGTVCLAMIAGMFFDWAVAIMPALAGVDDRTYVAVLQQANATINGSPLFLLAFLGAFVVTGVAAVLQYRLGARAAVRWIVAALVLYVVAVGITAGVSIPLNDTLQAAGAPDAIADPAGLRTATEGPWVTGHDIRTVATVLALGCLCRAMLLAPRGGSAVR
ncbi:DUF1772 domain-containing protein [Pseudonocardia nematodicida]|uniref:DUF1772 domain-containing protein n=1 Tax=Pseudonocardia nematodicida TaxID=1206997 RepID=A0ABV1K9K8_9PSEU